MMLRKASSDKFSIKKFYKQVSIQKSDHGFSVHLDKRQLKTPNSSPIYLSSEILALSIAFEWHSQKEHIKYFTMPLVIYKKTQLVTTSTDLDKLQIKHLFTSRIVSYLETDSICYRDLEDEKLLSPILTHLSKKFEIELPFCEGNKNLGFSIPQIPIKGLKLFQEYVEGLDNYTLVALESAISATKSVALGESLISNVIDIPTTVLCARLEEEKQIKENGRVEGSHDLDEIYMTQALAAARNLIILKSLP